MVGTYVVWWHHTITFGLQSDDVQHTSRTATAVGRGEQETPSKKTVGDSILSLLQLSNNIT